LRLPFRQAGHRRGTTAKLRGRGYNVSPVSSRGVPPSSRIEEVAAALGTWSRRHGIAVSFEQRQVRDMTVIVVLFTCS
jgi:hypothetical protein